MARLTVADELMENGKRRCHIIDGRAVREQAMKFYWRLKKYEDLGLSPEQIEAMQQHNHILIEELAEYEQLKKQGLLLKLPCKIGDDVYLIPSKVNYDLNVLSKHEESNRVYHQKVSRVVLGDGHWYMECDKDREFGTGRICVDMFLGETWFLSKQEAETKLKELENE